MFGPSSSGNGGADWHRRRRQFLTIRIGLLVGFLILGFSLHDHGSAYVVLRIVYVVLIVGFLLYRRQSVGRGGFGGGRRWQQGQPPPSNTGTGPNSGTIPATSYETPPPPPPPPPPAAEPENPN